MVVFRVGTHIPIPGVDPTAVAALFEQTRGSIVDIFNMFSGGAVARMAIFALGIMPYISASIMFQLLAAVFPTIEKLQKEGEEGRKKLKLGQDEGSSNEDNDQTDEETGDIPDNLKEAFDRWNLEAAVLNRNTGRKSLYRAVSESEISALKLEVIQ